MNGLHCSDAACCFVVLQGEYSIGDMAPQAVFDSLLYRLCYYKFGSVVSGTRLPQGFDSARGCKIGLQDFDLAFVEEAFTSQNSVVRIFRVRDVGNRW